MEMTFGDAKTRTAAMHFHGTNNTYSRIDRAYTSTNLPVSVDIDHKINTFSHHFQMIVIKREPTNLLNCGLLQNKEDIQHIRELWKNW